MNNNNYVLSRMGGGRKMEDTKVLSETVRRWKTDMWKEKKTEKDKQNTNQKTKV